MMIEATAMTSAEPVDITAIRIRKRMAYSPVVPSSFWATRGAARPWGMLCSLDISHEKEV